jgi:hypothetical protein
MRIGRELRRKAAAERLIGALPKEHRVIASDLYSKDHSVRSVAIYRLEKLGLKSAIPLIEKMLKDPDGIVRLNAVRALASLGSRKSVPLIEKIMLNDAQIYTVNGALTTLAELGSVKSIPSIELVLAGKFRAHEIDRKSDSWANIFVVSTLGKLTRLKNSQFFERLDSCLGKEQKRDGYSVSLHKNYYFRVYPETQWGEIEGRNKGARVLKIKVGGQTKCVLGFIGNSIIFTQIVGDVAKRGEMYELAVKEYLKIVKPLLLKGERAYMEVQGNHQHLKPLRDRFCNNIGVINTSKRRVREILEGT